jgi:hypothetical protein
MDYFSGNNMTEERVVTPTGYLKILITVDEPAASSILAFTRTGVLIRQEGVIGEFVSLRVGVEEIVALREGLYEIRAILGRLESDWINAEIKTGEMTSKIFHFGRKSTK